MSEDNIENLGDGLSKLEQFFEENKTKIYGVVIAIIVVVGGFYGYNEFIVKPKEEKAKESFWRAENALLNNNDYEQAVYGDSTGTFIGLARFVEEYGGTTAGNLAYYDLGVAYLNLGEFQKAIDALEQFSSDDEMLSSIAIGAIGDAKLELGKTEDAVSQYMAAANNSDNFFTGAIYLKKAGMAYEILGQNDKALETYERIKEKYPNSQESREVAKDIARLK